MVTDGEREREKGRGECRGKGKGATHRLLWCSVGSKERCLGGGQVEVDSLLPHMLDSLDPIPLHLAPLKLFSDFAFRAGGDASPLPHFCLGKLQFSIL